LGVAENTELKSADIPSQTPTSVSQGPPLIQVQGQTFSLLKIILGAFRNQQMISQLVPILAEAIKPTLQTAVECVFKSMIDTIEKQAETIEKQNQHISDLTERLDNA
jgi:hypothetical protein